MRISTRVLAGALFFVSSACVLAQAPPPGPAPKNPDAMLRVAFSGKDLDQVVKLISDELDIRFLYDDKILKRKVNLLAPVDIKRKDLFGLLLSILEMQGFTLVKAGPPEAEVWKVVGFPTPIANPPNKGILQTVQLKDVESLPTNEQLASLVVTLQYVDARSAFIAVQGMVSDPRMVQAIESANVVIVTDTAQNLKRIGQIVKLMDQPKPGAQIEVIQLKYADPADIVNKLTPLLAQIQFSDQSTKGVAGGPVPGGPPGDLSGQATRPVLVADQRTQQIIIFATKDRIEQLRHLIQDELDLPVKYSTRTVNIIFLRHSTADDLVKELQQIYEGLKFNEPPKPGQPGAPGQPTPTPGQPSSPTSSISPTQDTGTRIVSDKGNNAIIIVADQKTYIELSKIVQGLDIRRPQVQIEAHIVETSPTLDFGFGIEAATTDDPTKHNMIAFASSSFGLTRIVDLDNDGIPEGRVPTGNPAGSALTGLAFGLMKKKFANIPIFLNATRTKGEIDVLAQPRLVVNDNTNALFTVQDQVPTTTSTTTGTGIQQTTFSGFQNASLTLKITPHISERRYLRLEVDQLVEKFRGQGQVINGTEIPPEKTSREVTTTVTVPSERTVIIGGLTDNTDTKTVNGIPYISDIPLIGHLFERTIKTEDHKTIYIFITPTILVDPNFEDYLKISRMLQNKVFDAQGEYVGVHEPEDDKPGALDTISFRSPFAHCEVERSANDPCGPPRDEEPSSGAGAFTRPYER